LPAAAFVITAPPYECPTSTSGPGVCASTLVMYAESPLKLLSGFAGAITG